MTLSTGILISIMSIILVVYLYYYFNKRAETNEKGKTNYSPPIPSFPPTQKKEPTIPKQDKVYIAELAAELSPNGLQLWNRMLTIHLGNKQRARDLVFYERRSKPDAQIEELIQAAIDTYRKDND